MVLESACKFQSSVLNITEMADAPPLQVPRILGSWRFLVALRLCRATYSEKSEISQHCLALGTWHFSFFECFLSVFCFQSCSLLAYFLGWWVTFTFFWGVETTKEFLSLLTQEFLWNDFCIFKGCRPCRRPRKQVWWISYIWLLVEAGKFFVPTQETYAIAPCES